METAALDNMIRRLLMEGSNEKQVKLSEAEVRQLCVESRKVFLSQPSLLRLSAPIKICGDIHGQFQDLLSIFRRSGYPPDSTYLFLGNYVDHGEQSLDTICLLLAYKVRYPDRVFLLRGNHEDASVNDFYNDCRRKYNLGVWKTFTECFDCLPFAALVEERIFCIHGGLSPELNGPEQVEDIRRPTGIPYYGFLRDLLWSELDSNIVGSDSIKRGVSSFFGLEKVVEFLEKNDLDLICRAHHVVEDGYEFFAEGRLVTIFSATNYLGKFNNAGALLVVDETLMCSFEIFGPQARVLEKSTEKPSNMIRSKEVRFVEVEKPRNMIVSREKQVVHSLPESSEGHDVQILDEFMDVPKEPFVVPLARPGIGETAYADALKQLRILRTADFSSSVPVVAIHDCLVAITNALEFQRLSHGRVTALRNLQSNLLTVASQLFSHCQTVKPLKEAMEVAEQRSRYWREKKELHEERAEALKRKNEEYVAKDLELIRLRAELVRLEEEAAELKASVDRDLLSVSANNNEVVGCFAEFKKANAALLTYRKQLTEEETAVEEHSRRLSLLFDMVEDL